MTIFKSNGRVEFRFFARNARRVQVVGDFTNWLARPIEMAPGADGWWRVSAVMPAGEHRFRYLIDNSQWVTDYAAFGVAPNNFGQFDSVLVVTSAPRSVLAPLAAS